MNAELFELGKWLYLGVVVFLLLWLAASFIQSSNQKATKERAWSNNQKRKFINKIK